MVLSGDFLGEGIGTCSGIVESLEAGSSISCKTDEVQVT